MEREFIESPEQAAAHRASIAAAEAARKEAAERLKTERAATEAARQREQIEMLLQTRWLAAGGTLQEFAEQKQSLVTDHIREQMKERADATRSATAARYSQ